MSCILESGIITPGCSELHKLELMSGRIRSLSSSQPLFSKICALFGSVAYVVPTLVSNRCHSTLCRISGTTCDGLLLPVRTNQLLLNPSLKMECDQKLNAQSFCQCRVRGSPTEASDICPGVPEPLEDHQIPLQSLTAQHKRLYCTARSRTQNWSAQPRSPCKILPRTPRSAISTTCQPNRPGDE
jgi:hypothetical protein